MATVSERAKEVVRAMRKVSIPIHDGETIDEASAQFTAAYTRLIEQALLAERRLAMEACADIAEEPEFHCEACVGGSVSSAIAKSIRAAAEKEVAK